MLKTVVEVKLCRDNLCPGQKMDETGSFIMLPVIRIQITRILYPRLDT